MSTKLVLLTGATLLTLVLGSVGEIGARADAPPRPGTFSQQGARIYGVIEAIEGQSLMLATPVGSVTIVTDVNSRFRIPDVEKPGLDDLTIGDYLGAVGWWEEEGADKKHPSTFHAFGVAWMETDRAFPLAGKLTDISAGALTVETGHGLATVRVDGETVYHIRGVDEAGPGDSSAEPAKVLEVSLEVGMRVVARGTLNHDGSLLAQVVAVPWVGPRPIQLQGKVLAVEGDTFTIRAARGRQFDVLTDGTTEFRVPGVENPSIADLQVGARVAGEGVIEEDGAVRATLVIVLPEQVARLVGEVVIIEGTTLELDTPGGAVHILTDAATVFRVPGVKEPTLSDVRADDQGVIVGTWEDETTFHATIVGVRGGRRAGQRDSVRGRAIRVETDSLVLGTLHGQVTVLVDNETQYRVPDVDDPGLNDVNMGAVISARGTWNEDGTLQATGVAALGSR